MKYYLYISSSKVDMLYAQVPEGIKKKIAAEIKIDLPFLSISFKDKDKKAEESLYSKLKLLNDYITKYQEVGTFAHPKTYFRDTLPMKWAQIGDGLVYFSFSSKRMILGLGGSAHHLIGRMGEGSTELNPISNSNDQNIIAGLSKSLEISSTINLTDSEKTSSSEKSKSETSNILYAVERAGSYFVGPTHKFEFLARKLVVEVKNSRTIILGTPIYVAYSD